MADASPSWEAWVQFAAAHGVSSAPASVPVLRAFLQAVEASSGPIVAAEVCQEIARGLGDMGMDTAVQCPPSQYYSAPADFDYGTQATYEGLGAVNPLAGAGFQSAAQFQAGEAARALAIGAANVQLGTIRPTIGGLTIPEAEAMLVGLVVRDMGELVAGVPPISPALWTGQLVYDVRDPYEEWLDIEQIWERGGGDCEDLAAAVAAERTLLGFPSSVKIIRSGPGVAHAVVIDHKTGQLRDPSRTGGM